MAQGLSVRLQSTSDTGIYVPGVYGAGDKNTSSITSQETSGQVNQVDVYQQLYEAILRKMKERFGATSEKIADMLAKKYADTTSPSDIDRVAEKAVVELEEVLKAVAYEHATSMASKLLFDKTVPPTVRAFAALLAQLSIVEGPKMLNGNLDFQAIVNKANDFINKRKSVGVFFSSDRPNVQVKGNGIVIQRGTDTYEIDLPTLIAMAYSAAKSRIVPVYVPQYMSVNIKSDDGNNMEILVLLDRKYAVNSPPPMYAAIICGSDRIKARMDVRGWASGALGWGVGIAGGSVRRLTVCEPDLACPNTCGCSSFTLEINPPFVLLDEYKNRRSAITGNCGYRIENCFKSRYGGKAAAAVKINNCAVPQWLISADIRSKIYELSDKAKLLKILEEKIAGSGATTEQSSGQEAKLITA